MPPAGYTQWVDCVPPAGHVYHGETMHSSPFQLSSPIFVFNQKLSSSCFVDLKSYTPVFFLAMFYILSYWIDSLIEAGTAESQEKNNSREPIRVH